MPAMIFSSCAPEPTPIHDLPDAQITLSASSVGLNQEHSSFTIIGTVVLSDGSEPKYITYDCSEGDQTIVGFQQNGNDLTLTLETGVKVMKTSFMIYASYPESYNKPVVSFKVDVDKFDTPPLPPEE
jgi:hypothetical protein